MFFCGKKIGYLSLYEHEEKIGAAGFVRICGEKNQARITVQIKLPKPLSGQYPMHIMLKGESIPVAVVTLTNGKGLFEECVDAYEAGIIVRGRQVPMGEMEAITITISDEQFIEARWKQGKKELPRIETIPDEESPKLKIAEKAEEKKEQKESIPIYVSEDFSGDKWGQLLRQFQNVHPFGDDRLFISIELKDFVIFREDYQKLVHNSFLLHGFYNYKHLILGKDCKIGNAYETCFYLGVPGVFYEREKMVAVMFGFEGFECEGPVEIGKYGYYLRQIQI